MEKTFENDNFSTNWSNDQSTNIHRNIPPLVVSRAKSAGAIGKKWLVNLDGMISELERI